MSKDKIQETETETETEAEMIDTVVDMVDIETMPPSFKEMQKNITGYIKQLREDKNLTQHEIASQIGITQNGYAKLERGETKDLAVSRLLSISKVFNIEVTDLFPNAQEKNGIYIGDNSLYSNSSNNVSNTHYNNTDNELVVENEKLKLELDYQKKLYEQMEKQNTLFEKLLEKSE